MKTHCIFLNRHNTPFLVNLNSEEYINLIDTGYSPYFIGTKKECELYKEELVCDLTNND